MVKYNIVVENAHILFRNFSGKEGDFNPAGNRNFCVLIDDEHAKKYSEDGWNIRTLKPKDEGQPEQPYLPVAVRFGDYPPKVVLISSRGKTQLDESSVGILDWAEIQNVDLIVRPHNWSNPSGTKRGVKAYLKSIYVTLVEDEFESKYYDVPDSAANSIGNDGEY